MWLVLRNKEITVIKNLLFSMVNCHLLMKIEKYVSKYVCIHFVKICQLHTTYFITYFYMTSKTKIYKVSQYRLVVVSLISF